MEITIQNKEQFISNLLTPISKVSDSVVMQLYPDKIACLCSASNNIVLYAVSQVSTSDNVTTNLNITDVKRLIKVLNCIEDNTIKLIINSNNIEYKSTKTRFKYHLLEDGIIAIPNFNVSKIDSIGYNCEFTITYDEFNNIHKSSTFTADSNKLYIYTEDNKIHGELTDKTRSNIDSFSTILSESYIGDEFNKMPISMDVFRMLHVPKQSSVKVSLNIAKGVFVFDIEEGNNKLKYISSAMVS